MLGPLPVELADLGVTARLDALDNASRYTLDLHGIEVSYGSAGLELNGSDRDRRDVVKTYSPLLGVRP